MRKLDLKKEDYELDFIIRRALGAYLADTIINEAFINKNGTIYVNADNKSGSKIPKCVFILKTNGCKCLQLFSIETGKTFIPVADSELIGLLKTSSGEEDSYQVLTDMRSKLIFGKKVKQIKNDSNNILTISVNYNTSSLDIFLDLNSGQVVEYIGYITEMDMKIMPANGANLALYESKFVEEVERISNTENGNKNETQSVLLERVLAPKNKPETLCEGEK